MLLDAQSFVSAASIASAINVTVSSLASPTELNSRAAQQGDLAIARTVGAASDDCTVYYADTSSDAQSLPYIVTSATSGVKWIAIAGRYRNGTEAISALTASRLLRTDDSKNLESNAVLTNTRVLYADSNGWPTDSANLTFSGTLLTLGTGASSGLSIAATTGTTLTVSSTQASSSTSTGSIITSGGVGIAKEFWAGARSRIAVNGDSAQFSIQRTGTSTGLIYWGATGNRDTTNTYDIATVYGTGLSNRIEMRIVDSANPEISTAGSGSTGIKFTNTTSASSSTTGSVIIGDGTTATTVGIGGGNVNAGGTITAPQATLATGTITSSTPAITSSQTWNSGATTFVGYDYNITDTASAAASLIFNYKVGTVTKLSFGCASGLSQLNIKSASAVTAELNLNGNGTGPSTGLTIQHDASSDTYFYQRSSRSIFFGTSNATRGSISSAGVWNFSITTDATSISTGAAYSSGGFAAAKNIINGQNQCSGVTSTATAAGTTTLTSASTKVQIFTGTTTQTINFPAANVFGAGIAVEFIVINRSTGTVTPTRAGSDTFVGGGTTDPITTLNQVYYVSDGVSVWYKLAV